MIKTGTIEEILGYTNTRARRRAFFNYSTLVYCTCEATFFLLVSQFRKTGKKRQAAFLNEAYIETKDHGAAVNRFVAGGLNIEAKLFNTGGLVQKVNTHLDDVGRGSVAKIKKNGLANFITGKLSRDPTGIHPDIFDEILNFACLDLSGNMGANQHHTGDIAKFNPNATYQINPDFQKHLPAFRTKLESLKFNTTELGIY